MSVRIISGPGSLQDLKFILEEFGKNLSVFLVTGQKSFEKSGAETAVKEISDNHNLIHIKDFRVNPRIEDVKKELNIIKNQKPDLILAVGGGSVIDFAKLIKIGLTQSSQNLEKIVKGLIKPKDPSIPFVAVPTTAGSGSEATHFAVCYIEGEKFSVADNFLRPDINILDSKTLNSLPSYVKKSSALDCISQAIESLWAVSGTQESRLLAAESLTIGLANLDNYLRKKSSVCHQKMMIAANLAGQAINISKTTAAHAFSYKIAQELQISHGHAVWHTLPTIFRIHFRKRKKITQKLHFDAMGTLLEIIEKSKKNFADDVCLEEIFSLTGLQKMWPRNYQDFNKIIKSVNLERLENNPIQFYKDELQEIFFNFN